MPQRVLAGVGGYRGGEGGFYKKESSPPYTLRISAHLSASPPPPLRLLSADPQFNNSKKIYIELTN